MSAGTLIESNPASSFGIRLFGDMVCLCEDTKIGALLPGIEGRLGIEMTLVPSVSVLVVGSAGLILLNLDLFFFLKFFSRSSCLSFSLALKGFGRRSLMGFITTDGVSVGVSVEVSDKDPLLVTAEGDILADPRRELPNTELDLP